MRFEKAGIYMNCPFCGIKNYSFDKLCRSCGGALDTIVVSSVATLLPTSEEAGTSTHTGDATLQQGRYVIKKVLGQKNVGSTVLAADRRLASKLVVIKELVVEGSDSVRSQERLQSQKRELARLSQIEHPLISKVIDHFQDGERSFIVQEYVEGENLHQRMIENDQPCSEREVLEYASALLSALDYLSRQIPPVVHGDIKPTHIVLGTKDKLTHLVDFSQAHTETPHHALNTPSRGTPGYAAPELYQGNTNIRSDLYALGATMHYLLTNRNPQISPLARFPALRTLNPQISVELERIIERALLTDTANRYQKAADMKEDVDALLWKRFGIEGYTRTHTEALLPVSRKASEHAPTRKKHAQKSSPRRKSATVRIRWSRSWRLTLLMLFLLLLLLMGYTGYHLFLATGQQQSQHSSLAVPLGIQRTAHGEPIGMSDGTFAFDTDRLDGEVKREAAERQKAGDIAGADSLWHHAVDMDTSDAEALIYIENQAVIASGAPYITLVIGTTLTGDHNTIGVGRDDLQGAFIAQKEFNNRAKGPTEIRLRLLIANTGGNPADAKTVARQIAYLAHLDKTVIGVIGWSQSAQSLNAVAILGAAKIPMVSAAGGDALTEKSPYFFRVAAPARAQAYVGVHYAEQTLHARSAAVFVDVSNDYSRSLVAGFKKIFTDEGNAVVATENYTVGKGENLPHLFQDALSKHPDLIYFGGYPKDVSVLLAQISDTDPPILGGGAFYELGGYSRAARNGLSHLRFTAQAYPDQWDILSGTTEKPPFFSEYAHTFDPEQRHQADPYGYQRAESGTMLAYDATKALLNASTALFKAKGSSFTSKDLQQAVSRIRGKNSFQGVSGRIAFGNDGNPVDKAIAVVCVTKDDVFQLDTLQGRFLINDAVQSDFPMQSTCH